MSEPLREPCVAARAPAVRLGLGLPPAVPALAALVLLAALAADAAGVAVVGLGRLALAVAVCGAVALAYGPTGRGPALARMAGAAAGLLVASAALAVLSYAVARLTRGVPLVDGALLAWDRRLGLDWTAAYRWTAATPARRLFATLAYAAHLPQLVALVVVLGLTGRRAGGWAVLAAMTLAALVAIAGSARWPAVGHLADAPHVPDLLALRADTPPAPVALARVQGLIAFPSFHAALAVLLVWGWWAVRPMRALALVVNGAMLLATVPAGGHYALDVVAGVAVGAAACAAAGLLVERRGRGG